MFDSDDIDLIDEPHGFASDEEYMRYLANVWEPCIEYIKRELHANLYVVDVKLGELVETTVPDHPRRCRMALRILPLLLEAEIHREEQADAEL